MIGLGQICTEEQTRSDEGLNNTYANLVTDIRQRLGTTAHHRQIALSERKLYWALFCRLRVGNTCPYSTRNNMLRQISASEVILHNKPEDIWIVVNGQVYDMTDFSGEHPGGAES